MKLESAAGREENQRHNEGLKRCRTHRNKHLKGSYNTYAP
jgi:hypothetical protein